MANAAFTASADVLDDAHYQATMTQTGIDSASLYIEKWTLGADYTAPPDSSSSYSMIKVRATSDKLTCVVAGEPLIQPHLEMDLSPPDNIPSLTIKVTNTLWNDKTLVMPISADDAAGAAKFLADANFPIG
jgi:hypothetical protein